MLSLKMGQRAAEIAEAVKQARVHLVKDSVADLAGVLREHADRLGVPRRSDPESSMNEDDDGLLSYIESSSAGFVGSKAAKRKEKKKKQEQAQGSTPKEKLSAGEKEMRDFAQMILVYSSVCGADNCCQSLAFGSLAQEYQVKIPGGTSLLLWRLTLHA